METLEKNVNFKEKIVKELKSITIVFIALTVIVYLVFYKDNPLNIIKIVFLYFLLFILQGYALMLYWHKEFDFLERLVLGTIAGISFIGIIGYYLGWMGIGFIGQVIASFLIIGIMVYLIIRKESKKI